MHRSRSSKPASVCPGLDPLLAGTRAAARRQPGHVTLSLHERLDVGRARHRRRHRHRPGHRAARRRARARRSRSSTCTRPRVARRSHTIAAAGGRAVALAADVADEDAVGARGRDGGRRRSAASTASSPRPGSSTVPTSQPLDDGRHRDFFRVLAVNLTGTFSAIQHACRSSPTAAARIVTIASTAAIRGHGYGSGYTASKGGVVALTRLVAVQCGPQGVRANCICPGGDRHADDRRTLATPRPSPGRSARSRSGATAGRRHRRGRGLPALGRRAPPHRPDHGRRRRLDHFVRSAPFASSRLLAWLSRDGLHLGSRRLGIRIGFVSR